MSRERVKVVCRVAPDRPSAPSIVDIDDDTVRVREPQVHCRCSVLARAPTPSG
jgi:hypothetical protein